MALATKRKDCERTWNPTIFVVQDEIHLFFRLRTSKFVSDMISVGLLPITSDLQKFEKQPAGMFVKKRTAKQLEELCEVRRLASKLPTLPKDMLDEQRAAFQASVTSTDEKAVETHRVDTEQTNP